MRAEKHKKGITGKRIFALLLAMLLVGCSGLVVSAAPNDGKAGKGPSADEDDVACANADFVTQMTAQQIEA